MTKITIELDPVELLYVGMVVTGAVKTLEATNVISNKKYEGVRQTLAVLVDAEKKLIGAMTAYTAEEEPAEAP